jgi:AraC-like DNA-binding protein
MVADDYNPIHLGTYLAFFEVAASLGRDPWLGARLGLEIKPGDLGPIGVLFLQSASIWRGLQRLNRLTVSLQSRTEIGLRRADGLAFVEYRVLGIAETLSYQDAAFSLGAICQLIRLGFQSDWAPEEVHLTQPLADPEPLERLFGCPVSGARAANRIICDLRTVERIMRTEDSDLITVILRHLGQNMMVATSIPLAARVRALLADRLGRQPVAVADIAAELGLAPRTLQRRLAADGQGFGHLLSQERRALLGRLESEGIHDRADLARRLGFADPAVLWRARKSW